LFVFDSFIHVCVFFFYIKILGEIKGHKTSKGTNNKANKIQFTAVESWCVSEFVGSVLSALPMKTINPKLA